MRGGADARTAFLTLVGFRARGDAGFTLKVPAGFSEHSAGWRLAVARYRTNAPEAPPGLLHLPGVARGA